MRKTATLAAALGVLGTAVVVLAALSSERVVDSMERWWNRADSGTITLSGNIEAHESQLSFKGLQSRLVQLPFDEGQSVRQGTVVAEVDSRDLQQQVVIAEAAVTVQQRQLDAATKNLEAAQRVVDADRAELVQREHDLQRARDLQQQGFYSDAALEMARTALVQARAALARDMALEQVADRNVRTTQASAHSASESLRLADITRSYATLTAPFDGVIVSRDAELGEVVAPGTPIVTIADLDHVWVRSYLNETDLGRVHLGQTATVRADGLPGKAIAGRLSFVASEAEYTPKTVETHAERVTLVYRVKVDVDNHEHVLLPGMPVDVLLQPAANP
jgi:HlyD family secretion protein